MSCSTFNLSLKKNSRDSTNKESLTLSYFLLSHTCINKDGHCEITGRDGGGLTLTAASETLDRKSSSAAKIPRYIIHLQSLPPLPPPTPLFSLPPPSSSFFLISPGPRLLGVVHFFSFFFCHNHLGDWGTGAHGRAKPAEGEESKGKKRMRGREEKSRRCVEVVVVCVCVGGEGRVTLRR